MPWPIAYRCSSCDQQYEVSIAITRCYVFPDRYELPLFDNAVGWCVDCDGLVEVEQIATMGVIEHRLQEAIVTGADARTLDVRTRNLDWRKSRQSPPRCLRCHSTNVRIIDEVTGSEHPGCDGKFEDAAAPCIHYVTGYVQYLTTEGLSFDVDCLKRVALFVSQFTQIPISRVASHSLLETDLGITGPRAIQLMVAFGQEFRVDMSEFRYLDHFHGSGGRQNGISPPDSNQISLQRMARAVRWGEWD
ncbi:MAG TPA: hypothetical protein VGY55_02900 [Pirellulales bacterium]|jgi:hypothetical protein|nr:hypothetical protein [Pirellulales bacterium]